MERKIYYDDQKNNYEKWIKIVAEIEDAHTCKDYCCKPFSLDYMPYADIIYKLKWPNELDKINFEQSQLDEHGCKAIVVCGRIVDKERLESGQYKLTLIGLDEDFNESKKAEEVLHYQKVKSIYNRIVAFEASPGRKLTKGSLEELRPGTAVMISLIDVELSERDDQCIIAYFTDIIPENYMSYERIYINSRYMFCDESNLILEYVKRAGYNLDEMAQKEEPQGCYIATAVYKLYDCPEVWTLRRFRDNVLRKSLIGAEFVKLYYRISPKLVERFGGEKWFNFIWKVVLDKFVKILKGHGVEDTKYEDK